MRSIEIPRPDERGLAYRAFEILPGLLTWIILAMPVVLGFLSPKAAAYFIISYILIWFFRAMTIAFRSIGGWQQMKKHCALPWEEMNRDLEKLKVTAHNVPSWHARNLARVEKRIQHRILPSELYHAVIIPFWKETRDILEPTMRNLVKSEHDPKKLIVLLAYEQRGGSEVEQTAKELVAEFGDVFFKCEAVKHPYPHPGEQIGKGGNETCAGRYLQKMLEKFKIKPDNVLVTVIDADHRVHPKYFGALTYTYCSTEDPKHSSYQPISVFTNNIWDAPAPMRVIATGNSFWWIVQSLRQHTLRNFAAHAQPMSALIDTDFWSVRSIVEDGHQYWRTYFRYDGHHEVFPIYIPIYQDAVLTDSYRRTLIAQFYQLRRWAYGASDIAYVAYTGWFKPNNIPKYKVLSKLLRLLEGHVSWSTAPIILAVSAIIPLFIHPQSFIANQLPHVISKIQLIALVGIFVTMFLSIKMLPPRPERYKRHRTIWMALQWLYMPLTTIFYGSAAAINSQTRLMFGWYIEKFDLTEKAVKK